MMAHVDPPTQESIRMKWGFPKIRGTLCGVPIMRTIVFGGLYWGSLVLGNYQIGFSGVCYNICTS